jgi:hypothetical protein
LGGVAATTRRPAPPAGRAEPSANLRLRLRKKGYFVLPFCQNGGAGNGIWPPCQEHDACRNVGFNACGSHMASRTPGAVAPDTTLASGGTPLFVAVLDTAEERAWRRLTIALWAESLHDRRLAVAVGQGVDAPRAMLADMIRQARSRGELPDSLNDDAMARLLIAAFQGLVLQQAWDAGVDAAACAEALAVLIASRRASGLRGRRTRTAARSNSSHAGRRQ